MAVFGRLEDLKHLFLKTTELETLFVYLNHALDPNHSISQKLYALSEGESFEENLPFGMRLIGHCYRLKNEPFFESHQSYYDIQMPIEGFEAYWLGNFDQFALFAPYDAQKDLIIWKSQMPHHNQVWLSRAEIAILAPYDIHAVGMGEGDTLGKLVRKIICKVPAEYIKHRL